jgi:hypothetical protein
MKNFAIIFFSVLFLHSVSEAQTSAPTQLHNYNASVEIGTWFYINTISLTLERRLHSSSSGNINLFGKLGFGIVHILKSEEENEQLNGGLIAMTLLMGKGSHHFEINGGSFLGTYIGMNTDKGFRAIPIVTLAYRFQKPGGRSIFKLNMGILGIGVGFGYAF